MCKYQFRESDIYLPGTDIPKNKLGIEDADLLREVEEALLEQAYSLFVLELNPSTRFDEAYFKMLHKQAFAPLYDWAGEYRTVDMSKGGSLFCLAKYLPKESQRLFRQLEQEDFLGQARQWPKERFAERLGYYQCELITLHPFYDLNGRITRLFFDLIAISNGYYPIDYGKAMSTETEPFNSYIRASMECVQGADNSGLRQIILDGLNKREDEP